MDKEEFSRSRMDPSLKRILAAGIEADRRRMTRPELGEILDLSSRSKARTRLLPRWAFAGAAGIAAVFLFFLLSFRPENVDSIRRSVAAEKQALFAETQAFLADSWNSSLAREDVSFGAWTDILSDFERPGENEAGY